MFIHFSQFVSYYRLHEVELELKSRRSKEGPVKSILMKGASKHWNAVRLQEGSSCHVLPGKILLLKK